MTTQALLLDLGNVVVGVDFRRVFQSWAAAAGVDPQHFYQRWQMDDAYREHERGTLSFEDYSTHLSGQFDVSLTDQQWLDGWNDIWTGPFHKVIALLPELATRYPLYCFTNTNHSHTVHWRHHYADALANFRQIFVSSELGVRKPDPAAFHQVCEQLSTNPAEVLFLDDTLENVHGAQQAGLQAVHVPEEADVVKQLELMLG